LITKPDVSQILELSRVATANGCRPVELVGFPECTVLVVGVAEVLAHGTSATFTADVTIPLSS
jgi:hypothetical protein